MRAQDFAKAIGACAASHIEHVVTANGRASEGGGVDVFLHSWNPELRGLVDRQYAPYLRAALHQPVEFVDKMKARSQALSIGRAAQLMTAHEAARRKPYAFCLVLRSDAVVGAPIVLRTFDFDKIWFAEHCCMNEANTAPLKALVRSQCAAEEGAALETQRTPFRKRVLGPCRASQYGGQWGLERKPDDFYYFVMDWWVAARPSVVASWMDISHRWVWYAERMKRMMLWRFFSHYVWAFHVHDALNRTADVRFKAGVRVLLVRAAYTRLNLGADRLRQWHLGEYQTDAVGNCGRMLAYNNASVASDELLRTPVARTSPFGAGYAPHFAVMAEQCASARLAEPIICCGAKDRHCGKQVCTPSYTQAHKRFYAAGQAYGRAVRDGDVPPALA